jgi:hypothetical protein
MMLKAGQHAHIQCFLLIIESISQFSCRKQGRGVINPNVKPLPSGIGIEVSPCLGKAAPAISGFLLPSREEVTSKTCLGIELHISESTPLPQGLREVYV